ncbi:MAG: xanthine dehydrogenase family protein subunit M [Candidatus Aminicenantaceae bacterium]
MSNIKFHSPSSLTEAIQLLGELEDARILAGGTDLLVDIKEGLTEVKNLISIQDLPGLDRIERADNRLKIGARVSPKEVAANPDIQHYLPSLAEAAGTMASSHIRSMATIGGNISSAVPSADLPPPLIAAEAAVELACSVGIREVSLAKFFTGPRQTVCAGAEILTFVQIPLPPPETGACFQRFSLRESNALAVASVAARLTLKDEKIEKAAVVLGAVAPTPLLAAAASQFLVGKSLSDDLYAQAAALAKEECRPISDLRGSIWFRKEIVQVLTQRALAEAAARARTKHSKTRLRT